MVFVANKDEASRTVDRSIVLMRRQGLTFRQIGQVFRMSRQAIQWRLKTMDPGERARYEAIPLGDLRASRNGAP